MQEFLHIENDSKEDDVPPTATALDENNAKLRGQFSFDPPEKQEVPLDTPTP